MHAATVFGKHSAATAVYYTLIPFLARPYTMYFYMLVGLIKGIKSRILLRGGRQAASRRGGGLAMLQGNDSFQLE